MNKGIMFLLGFFSGVFVTLIICATLWFGILAKHIKTANYSKEYPETEMTKDATTDLGMASDGRNYIDVHSKKGIVSLYFGMPKDSVKVLMGRPNRTSAMRKGRESWDYDIPGAGRHGSSLNVSLDFEDNKLSSVSEL